MPWLVHTMACVLLGAKQHWWIIITGNFANKLQWNLIENTHKKRNYRLQNIGYFVSGWVSFPIFLGEYKVSLHSLVSVTGEFPAQRPVTRSFDVFCDLRLNKQLSKQCWGWWFETPSHPLWRHWNGSAAHGSFLTLFSAWVSNSSIVWWHYLSIPKRLHRWSLGMNK